MSTIDYVAMLDFKDHDNDDGKNSIYNMVHRIVRVKCIKVTKRYIAVSVQRKTRTVEQERKSVTVDRKVLLATLKDILKWELDNPSNHPRQVTYIDRLEYVIRYLKHMDLVTDTTLN